MNNNLFDLLENTSRNIFLTGKAGTGKTTFLNNFVKKHAKNTL
jgi:predicted NACHT family NTPase